MRILLCAKNDLPALMAVNELAPLLVGHDLTLWLSDVTRPVERERADLALLRFFERTLPLEWLLPANHGARPPAPGTFAGYPALAAFLGTTVKVVPRLGAVADAFRALAPDLILSIRFSHIFPPDLIAVPRHGILNVHPGRLPDYAGLFAPFHQLAAGETAIGCTVHFVDAGIDTGPVVGTGTLPVDPARSLQWHVCRAYPTAIPVLMEAVERLATGGTVPAVPQDRSRYRYHKLPGPGESRAFQERFRLVSPEDFQELMAPFGIAPQPAGATPAASVPAAVRTAG